MTNQNQQATPVNYLNPEKNASNICNFPHNAPSMAAPQPMPPAHSETIEGQLEAEMFVNILWAGAVVVLTLLLKWMPMKFMAASIIVNAVVSLAALMNKSPKAAHFATDMNKGLVILTLLATLSEFLFTVKVPF